MTPRSVVAALAAAAALAGCSSTAASRRTGNVNDSLQVLSAPVPAGGARFDVTHRPGRGDVGLPDGSRTIVVGQSTDPPFTATLVTAGGEVTVEARDVAVDAEPSDGPVAQLIVHLVVAGRSEVEAGLRSHGPLLGVATAEIDTFLRRAAEAKATSATDTVSTNLRGGTTGGGSIEVVLRYNPNDDTIFENIQVTWLS